MAFRYLPFIDWMKCAGIFLIVCGHVAAHPINGLTPPIYPKQIGVALFLFAMGFSLARETRAPWKTVFNRLFEIYLFGVAVALLVSAVGALTSSGLQLSNYLPFAGGVNVAFNNFPANPTTWYMGTYFHLLILWAVLVKDVRVRPWMIVVSAAVEIVVRAALSATAGLYVGYMTVPNWATSFLLGTYYGQRERLPSPEKGLLPWAAALVGLAATWPFLVDRFVVERSFPHMRLSLGTPLDPLFTSACVTFLYVGHAFLVFQVASRLPELGWVKFFARNTLIVFLAHMPVFYAIEEPLRSAIGPSAPRLLLQLLICFVGLALVSEAVLRVVRPKELREHAAWELGIEPAPRVSGAG